MSDSSIRIEITRKSYPRGRRGTAFRVIENLDLTLRDGEFICLVGPSGCGKSTLLNIVAGLDTAFDGKIDFGLAGAQPRIGFVFQEPRLLPWRTVRENIQLALPPESNDAPLVEHLLDVMALSSCQHQYPGRLSLGMSRRVALVRAFAVQPDLLILDEPFVSLDVPIARRIRRLLIKVWEERPHTVLFVTHDVREAIAIADRIVFLGPCPTQPLAEIVLDQPRDTREQANVMRILQQRLADTHPPLAQWL